MDYGGSELIGASGFKWKHENESNSCTRSYGYPTKVLTSSFTQSRGAPQQTAAFPRLSKKLPLHTTGHWLVKEALKEEIQEKFLHNKAWAVVPRPDNRKVVQSKWGLRF